MEDEIRAHYRQGLEKDRLDRPAGSVEFARTREMVGRLLPPPPATVADDGGGPGRYTLWLADLGYRVVHRDLMSEHVEELRSQIPPGHTVDTAVGDARTLDLDDASVDAALLLGPIYHLERRRDRLQALGEARRIVRPGGPTFIAAISRWATSGRHSPLAPGPAVSEDTGRPPGRGTARPLLTPR